MPGNPQVKAIAGLATAGIIAPSVLWMHAVENPNGLNRVMYSMTEYQRTGKWPNPTSTTPPAPAPISDAEFNSILDKVADEVQDPNFASNISSNSSNFTNFDFSGLPLFKDSSLNDVINFSINIFQITPAEGHLDDILGQQLLFYFLIFTIAVSLTVLFIIYL